MCIIAELRVRSEELVLTDALQAVPDLTLEVIAEVATDPNRPYLFFWAHGTDLGAFERAMTEDPTVASWEKYSQIDDRRLYRLQVSAETDLVTYPAWVELGINPVEATWREGWWHASLRLPDRDAVGTVRTWCRNNGVDIEVHGIFDDTRVSKQVLTPEQREVLVRAHELGYFEIPREHTLADVAAELGVSSQAISERLRRGYKQLVAEHVL